MYRGRLSGGGGGKKREGAKEERSKISGKAGSSTISHMEKFPPLFAHRRWSGERNARLQVSRVFPPLFPTSVVHEGNRGNDGTNKTDTEPKEPTAVLNVATGSNPSSAPRPLPPRIFASFSWKTFVVLNTLRKFPFPGGSEIYTRR